MFDRICYQVNHWVRRSIPVAAVWALIFLVCACQTIPTKLSPGSGEKSNTPDELPEATDFPSGFPTPDAEKYGACLAEGGRWEVLGFSGPGCNLPTADGGKSCQGSTECESACLADPKDVMVENGYGDLIPNPESLAELNALENDRVGACSPWIDNFGCQVWVVKGQYVEICVD